MAARRCGDEMFDCAGLRRIAALNAAWGTDTGLFAQARATGEDMDALGDKMRARKEELLAKFEAEGLPPPVTRSMKGAKVELGEPVA